MLGRSGSGFEVESLSHVICLSDPSGKVFVELIERFDTELVHEQTLRVGRGRPDPRIRELSLEVEVPVQPALLGFGARETAARSLERDRRLRHRHLEIATRLDELDEPLIESNDRGVTATEMSRHRPLFAAHVAQV